MLANSIAAAHYIDNYPMRSARVVGAMLYAYCAIELEFQFDIDSFGIALSTTRQTNTIKANYTQSNITNNRTLTIGYTPTNLVVTISL